MKYITTVNDKEFVIEIDHENQITVNGEPYAVDFQRLAGGGTLSLLLNNSSLEAIVEERDESWEVLLDGELYTVTVQDERSYRLAQARGTLDGGHAEVAVKSPMPGLILDVLVAEGDEVRRGDTVVILESMKMENELRASRDGRVTHVMIEAGASVDKDQELVKIGDLEAD